MAKNLVDGTNIVTQENGNDINLELSSTYQSNLIRRINNSFKENNVYSTTETVIGTYLGKPLYRRIVYFGDLPNNGQYARDHGINVAMPVRCSGVAINSATGMKFTIPMYNIDVWFDINQIGVKTTSDRSNLVADVTIEYTKTTD